MRARPVFLATCLVTFVWLFARAFLTLPARLSPPPGIAVDESAPAEPVSPPLPAKPARPAPAGITVASEERELSGVIDRIVDDEVAVVLVGTVGWELLAPASSLPPGARPGTWLILRRDDSGAFAFEIDERSTAASLERVELKLQALKRQGITSP